MCGIAGLFLKDRTLEGDLGALLAGMLVPLSDRGPDSTGFAVYGEGAAGTLKLTLRGPRTLDADALLKRLGEAAGGPVVHRRHDTHLVVAIPADREAAVRQALHGFLEVAVVGGNFFGDGQSKSRAVTVLVRRPEIAVKQMG